MHLALHVAPATLLPVIPGIVIIEVTDLVKWPLLQACTFHQNVKLKIMNTGQRFCLQQKVPDTSQSVVLFIIKDVDTINAKTTSSVLKCGHTSVASHWKYHQAVWARRQPGSLGVTALLRCLHMLQLALSSSFALKLSLFRIQKLWHTHFLKRKRKRCNLASISLKTSLRAPLKPTGAASRTGSRHTPWSGMPRCGLLCSGSTRPAAVSSPPPPPALLQLFLLPSTRCWLPALAQLARYGENQYYVITKLLMKQHCRMESLASLSGKRWKKPEYLMPVGKLKRPDKKLARSLNDWESV